MEYTHRRSTKLQVFVVLFLLTVVVGSAAASRNERRYKLDLTLVSEESRRPFDYEAIFDRREYDEYQFNKRSVLEDHFLKARKAMAKRRGYVPQIYGDRYYKLLRIRSWSYELTDLRRNRVIDEGSGRGAL